MKKVIISILLIITMLALSLSVYCDDNADIPLGDSLDPTIKADSLEDFSEKLQTLKADDIEAYYYRNVIPGTYEKVLERIDSGKDVVYIPDIGLDEMRFTMFVMSYNADYKTGNRQKYNMVLHEGDEIGLETSCSFSYNNISCNIGYNDGDSVARDNVTLHGKKVSHTTSDKWTTLFFEVDGEKLGISLNKVMTEDEIKALPRGMFYPNIVSITEIKNGDYSSITVDLVVDDPKESDNPECVIER